MRQPLLIALMLAPLLGCSDWRDASPPADRSAIPDSNSGETSPKVDTRWEATRPPTDLLHGDGAQ